MRIPPELLAAYRAARYLVRWRDGPAWIRWGEVADLPAYAGARIAIVTPDNPFSRSRPEAENILRRTAFRARLSEPVWPTEGHDPKGVWPEEHGFAVPDATDAQLDAWMVELGQNAILVVPRGRPAHLRLHPAATEEGA